MSASRFTEADLRRAVQGAMKGGIAVSCVEIAADGTIRILVGNQKTDQVDTRKPQEW